MEALTRLFALLNGLGNDARAPNVSNYAVPRNSANIAAYALVSSFDSLGRKRWPL